MNERNERGLVPIPFRKVKNNIKWFIEFGDIPYIAIWFVLLLVFLLLPIKVWIGIVLSLITFFIMLFLIVPINTNKDKGRTLLIYWLKYLSSHRKVNTLQLLNELKIDIESTKKIDSRVFTLVNSDRYLYGFKIRGEDPTLLLPADVDKRISSIKRLFMMEGINVNLYKETINSNFENEIRNLEEIDKKIKEGKISDNTRKSLVMSEIRTFKQFQHGGLYKSTYFIVVSSRKKKRILETLETFENTLDASGYYYTSCNKEVLSKLIDDTSLTDYLNLRNDRLEKYKTDLKEYKKLTTLNEANKNNGIDNPIDTSDFISPKLYEHELNKTTKYKPNHIKIDKGEKYIQMGCISQFPSIVPAQYWRLLNATDDVAVRYFGYKLNSSTTRKYINKSIVRLQEQFEKARKLTDEKSYSNSIEDVDLLADEVISGGEVLSKGYFLVKITANSLVELRQKAQEYRAHLKSLNIRYEALTYRQKEALISWRPTFVNDSFLKTIGGEIPANTLAIGLPFFSSSLRDEKGTLLGFTGDEEEIVFDANAFVEKGSKIMNGNRLIIGNSGSGKSTMAKKIMISSIAKGNRVIIIDPENEYSRIARNLGGVEIDLADDKQNKLNPLEVFVGTDKLHINKVINFVKIIFPVLNPEQEVVIKRALIQLYDERTKKGKKEWPTLTDLHKQVKKDNSKLKNLSESKETIEEFLYSLTMGQEGDLWDGQSSIKSDNSQLIVFNIQKLRSVSSLAQVQLWLAFEYIYKFLKENQDYNFKKDAKEANRFLDIYVDESHLLVQDGNIMAAREILSIVKRARKYFASLTLITQNMNDFIENVDIRRETLGILANSDSMIIGRQDGKELKVLIELLDDSRPLTEVEINAIANNNRGEFLISLGKSWRSWFYAYYSPVEKYFTGIIDKKTLLSDLNFEEEVEQNAIEINEVNVEKSI
ncbi:MAG: DUF87 domain-containing protein [Mycoplasmataceae bacterium]|nr:DUF87 domain-containing protein [Mycoplasmataceae bacterium]